MRNPIFRLPIIIIISLTVILGILAYAVDSVAYPLASSLIINLLASGITVIATTLLIDKAIRDQKSKDIQPGLEYATKALTQELEYFFENVGHMKIALDNNIALGAHLMGKKRDLKQEFRDGLKAARQSKTQWYAGKSKYVAGWPIHSTDRLLETLKEILENFSYALSNANVTELYKLKKEISLVNTQLKQASATEFDIAEGYFSPDEGYLSNRDYGKNELSSMYAYYVNRNIHLALKLHGMKLRPPVA